MAPKKATQRTRKYGWVQQEPRATSYSMPSRVPHPEAGQSLNYTSMRCECGGVTGIGGTPDGAKKWRRHLGSDKHATWEGWR